MSGGPVSIFARRDLSPAEIDAIEDRLYAYNARRVGRDDAAPLGFVAEEQGQLLGSSQDVPGPASASCGRSGCSRSGAAGALAIASCNLRSWRRASAGASTSILPPNNS